MKHTDTCSLTHSLARTHARPHARPHARTQARLPVDFKMPWFLKGWALLNLPPPPWTMGKWSVATYRKTQTAGWLYLLLNPYIIPLPVLHPLPQVSQFSSSCLFLSPSLREPESPTSFFMPSHWPVVSLLISQKPIGDKDFQCL